MSTFPAELAGTWEIDTTHSTVGFAAKHAMVATTRGHFTEFSGKAVIDPENIENSSAQVTIQVASVVTGVEGRDAHLKSGDFFDAEQFPTMEFTSLSATLKGDDVVMTGDLTIRGVTHPAEINWEFGGVATDPYGTVKAGFEGTATVLRKDWGLTWNASLETGGVLVSDKIKLVLDIEANKVA